MDTFLGDLHTFFESWNIRFCLILHCLLAATFAPDLKDKYLLHYWTSFLGGFGGGFLSSLIIMMPSEAPVPLLGSNSEGVIWTLSWWLVNYSPFDIGGRIVRFPPVMMACLVGSAYLRASLIAWRIDLAVRLYPGVVIAPLILGTIGGFAGKACMDCVRGGLGIQSNPETHEMMHPSFIWRSAFLCALLHYIGVYHLEVLTAEHGIALLRAILVGHTIMRSLLNRPLDFTNPAASIGHTVCNIPRPKVGAKVAPEDAAKTKKQQ